MFGEFQVLRVEVLNIQGHLTILKWTNMFLFVLQVRVLTVNLCIGMKMSRVFPLLLNCGFLHSWVESYWPVSCCSFQTPVSLFLCVSFIFQSSSAEAGVADRWALDINTESLGDFPICLWVLAMWSRVVGWDGGYSPGSAFQSFCIMWKSAFAAPLSLFSFAARRKNKQDWFYFCKAWKHNFVLFGTSMGQKLFSTAPVFIRGHHR